MSDTEHADHWLALSKLYVTSQRCDCGEHVSSTLTLPYFHSIILLCAYVYCSSWTNRLLVAKDHASVQNSLNITHKRLAQIYPPQVVMCASQPAARTYCSGSKGITNRAQLAAYSGLQQQHLRSCDAVHADGAVQHSTQHRCQHTHMLAMRQCAVPYSAFAGSNNGSVTLLASALQSSGC
eukprot:998-Heterococcus_DN1.PRE.4